jgi:hypothetical protein
VNDYAGQAVGMPASVSKLEELIDQIAGTKRWVDADRDPSLPRKE